jgi:KDO2-lipid IV(A) lauroyltransferase
MGNYILYKIGIFLALHLPEKLVYTLAEIVSFCQYLISFKDRCAVRNNLKAILPKATFLKREYIVERVFANFGKYLVDFFRFSLMTKGDILKKVRLVNTQYFDEALKNKKGAVILTAHIGNWELGGAAIAANGYPLLAIALPHAESKVNDFFNRQREERGVKIVPIRKAAFECLHALKNNTLVAILGDRDFTSAGIIVDFFGKPTLLPKGPAMLALKIGCPIIPGFSVMRDGYNLDVIFEKPLEFIKTGDIEEDIKEITKKFALRIEEYIRTYPEQWFMFRKFWQD